MQSDTFRHYQMTTIVRLGNRMTAHGNQNDEESKDDEESEREEGKRVKGRGREEEKGGREGRKNS